MHDCVCSRDFSVLEKDAVGIEIFLLCSRSETQICLCNATIQVHVTLGRVNVLRMSSGSRIFRRSGSLDPMPSRIGIEHICLKLACCTQVICMSWFRLSAS